MKVTKAIIDAYLRHQYLYGVSAQTAARQILVPNLDADADRSVMFRRVKRLRAAIEELPYTRGRRAHIGAVLKEDSRQLRALFDTVRDSKAPAAKRRAAVAILVELVEGSEMEEETE